jgi:hypothetical protein
MAFNLIESAQHRGRAVNSAQLAVTLAPRDTLIHRP